jgi:hypothetical protein
MQYLEKIDEAEREIERMKRRRDELCTKWGLQRGLEGLLKNEEEKLSVRIQTLHDNVCTWMEISFLSDEKWGVLSTTSSANPSRYYTESGSSTPNAANPHPSLVPSIPSEIPSECISDMYLPVSEYLPYIERIKRKIAEMEPEEFELQMKAASCPDGLNEVEILKLECLGDRIGRAYRVRTWFISRLKEAVESSLGVSDRSE